MQNILLISIGAIIGASLRYFLAQYVARVIPSTLPYGTFIINITACLVLGFFLVWTSERVIVDPRWRLLIAIGFVAATRRTLASPSKPLRCLKKVNGSPQHSTSLRPTCYALLPSQSARLSPARFNKEERYENRRTSDDVPHRVRQMGKSPSDTKKRRRCRRECVSCRSRLSRKEHGSHGRPCGGGRQRPSHNHLRRFRGARQSVLPKLFELVPHRLIVRENVTIEQGNLD